MRVLTTFKRRSPVPNDWKQLKNSGYQIALKQINKKKERKKWAKARISPWATMFSWIFYSTADDGAVGTWWYIVTDRMSQSAQRGATHTLSSLCLVTSKEFSVLLVFGVLVLTCKSFFNAKVRIFSTDIYSFSPEISEPCKSIGVIRASNIFRKMVAEKSPSLYNVLNMSEYYDSHFILIIWESHSSCK